MRVTVQELGGSREHLPKPARVLAARATLSALETLRQHRQPEALLAGLVVREPWQLLADGSLADLRPDEFRARPEYGAVVDIVRALLDLEDAPTVAREIATNPAPYFADHEQLALALLHDAPIAYGVPAVLAGIRERNRIFDHATEALDLVRELPGAVLDLARVELPFEESVLVPGRRYEPVATEESTAAELAAQVDAWTTAWDAMREQVTAERVEREVLEHLYSLRECTRVSRMAVYESARTRMDVVPTPCGTRACPGCSARIVERIVTAIDAHEGPVFHTVIEADERAALLKRIRRAGALYKVFPCYEDGRALVVTTLEGVGPELYRDVLPDVVAHAYADVPSHRNVSGSGAWSHSAATVKRQRKAANSSPSAPATVEDTATSAPAIVPTTTEAQSITAPVREVLGRVRVSVLAERTAAVELTGKKPDEFGAELGLEEHRRRRRYEGVTPAVRDELVRRWRVQSPEEFAAERAAARTLTRGRARDFARRAS